MNNMFSYIYELKGEGDIKNINEGYHKNEEVTFKLQDNYFKDFGEIRGYVTLEDKKNRNKIPFIFREQSKLMFILTPFNNQKIFVVNFFNSQLNGKLETFIPKVSCEHKLLCDEFQTLSASLFIDGEIIDSSDEEIDICENNLNQFELLDAVLYLSSKNIVFFYYRNALKFSPNITDEDMEIILHKFEKTMLTDSHA
ncbi:hypothetical protein [Methanobacterium sp.]|uniref:hypothetical protein n=1 Tax=Methanobacterium sp. TaxID=2164 RepID=UPI002ABA7D95|nr:hypothetical protein [Methanobacterium sp.]MDY9922808.1 hypothetical protein [Methanobacterium sp.]